MDIPRDGSRLQLTATRRTLYDEEMFQYFLSLEEMRSQRSSACPPLLLLVDVKPHVTSSELDDLFETLRSSLRETDFVGWYTASRVVGAVLTQPGEALDRGDACDVVCERVAKALNGHSRGAKSLNVRVHQHPPNESDNGTSLWPHAQRL